MIIKEANFKTSVANAKNLPDDMPEIVFAGKSNVGKSSLINMLANRNRLAISSNTPGRTRLVNFFTINNAFYFVDLPGYGYSKSGKGAEMQYSKLIETFLNTSKNIKHVFILIDIRNGVGENDRMLVDFCYGRLPFSIVCTKADKLSSSAANLNKNKIAAELGIPKEQIILSSSNDEKAKQALLSKIEEVLGERNVK